MEQLISSYKASKNLHHAYFLVGEKDALLSKLIYFLEKDVKIKTSGNPDFWVGKFNTLNIEGARAISLGQERRDFSGDIKIFIIQADFITEEAQNSLLKVFEEPTVGTHFFIISPQDILLPTLRSRVSVVLDLSNKENKKSVLNLKLGERLSLVKEITDGISDEEKTKQDAIALLNQIESELYEKGIEKSAEPLKICEEARLSLYDRGAPIKIILENVMLNI